MGHRGSQQIKADNFATLFCEIILCIPGWKGGGGIALSLSFVYTILRHNQENKDENVH